MAKKTTCISSPPSLGYPFYRCISNIFQNHSHSCDSNNQFLKSLTKKSSVLVAAAITSLSLSLSLICWAMNWTPCIAFSTWAYLLKMHPPPNKSTENWSKPPNESECEKWNYSSGQKRDLWAEMLLAYWFKFCNKNYIKIIIIKLKKYIINKNI